MEWEKKKKVNITQYSIFYSSLNPFFWVHWVKKYIRALSGTDRKLTLKVGNWVCSKAFMQPSIAILTFQAWKVTSIIFLFLENIYSYIKNNSFKLREQKKGKSKNKHY